MYILNINCSKKHMWLAFVAHIIFLFILYISRNILYISRNILYISSTDLDFRNPKCLIPTLVVGSGWVWCVTLYILPKDTVICW